MGWMDVVTFKRHFFLRRINKNMSLSLLSSRLGSQNSKKVFGNGRINSSCFGTHRYNCESHQTKVLDKALELSI